MESRMEAYLNAAISGNTENLPNPISRIDFLLCELIKTLGESGASIEEVEKIVTDKVAEIVADAPEDFNTLKELSDWIYTHEESAAAMNTAIQSNTNSIESLMTDVNKKANSDDVYDKATADSRFLGIDATADKAVADENGSNISETFSTMKNDIALNRTTLGTQCKNMLKNNGVTKTVSGVTFTVNSDGSVTVNGTNTSSSAAAYIELCGFKNYGTGKLTASLNSTDSNLYMSVFDNSWVGIGFVCDKEVTWDNNNKDRLIRLVVKPGATINNITVYPMIRYADIIDDTYEPYKENIDERLIENKSNAAINRSTLGYQCKNLLKNNAVTQTVSGVTFTINDDKSVTVNGTATAQISFVINSKVGLGIGNYILTGCPSGGRWNTFYLTAYASSAWLTAPDFGSSCKIENKTVTQVVITIASGYTANNLKFYPMLRDADIINDNYEPYKESVDERLINNTSDIAINRTTIGYQCKNLLKIVPRTIKSGGVTCVIDDDGIVTVNGTASETVFINIRSNISLDETLEYTLTGTYNNSSYGYIYYQFGETADGSKRYNDTGNGVTFKGVYGSVYLRIPVGAVLNNVKYYPMLRYADITDDTYEPYKENVDERLIQNKSDIAVNKSTLGYQCKNLLPFPKTISKDGITFTCDENGYMTASNTTSDARQWAAYNSQYNVKLKPGKYILSFASASVCTNAYGNIKVLSANDKQIVDIGQTNYYNKTSGAVEFTIDTEQTVYIMSKIFDGKTAIMLRYADITDSTYEPYQPSLYEQIIALEARIAALEV